MEGPYGPAIPVMVIKITIRVKVYEGVLLKYTPQITGSLLVVSLEIRVWPDHRLHSVTVGFRRHTTDTETDFKLFFRTWQFQS